MFRDIKIEPALQSDSRAGRSVVAVIGIDQYRKWPRLSNAVNDARGTLNAFSRLGFEPLVEPLYNEAATAEALRSFVMDDLAKLGRNDSLVLFFAGHGHTVTQTYEEGDSVKTGYIIPVDGELPGGSTARWLRLDTWLSDIARIAAKHILVFLDACHSGIALGSLIKWRDSQQHAEPLEALGKKRSRKVITSAMDDQRALDSGPVPGHSLFTGCLLEALGGALVAHGERVTGLDIGTYLQRRVASYPSSVQTPDYGALEGDKHGQLVFELPTEQPSIPTASAPRPDGPGARFGKSLAVVIGIDTYGEGIAPLRSAVADAKALAEVLRRDQGFETLCLLGGEARLPRLIQLLREQLPAALGPGDRLLLYFAGHGVSLEGEPGQVGYLVPAGARRAERDGFLPLHILHGELARLPVRHALVILDCCFAGAPHGSGGLAAEPAKIYRERYDHYLEREAWQVLVSPSGDPLALDLLENDRGDGGDTRSPFARALIEGLGGAADYLQDGVITADELTRFVRERLALNAELGGRRPIPQLSVLGRHGGGRFLFGVPGRAPQLPPAPELGARGPYRGLASFRQEDHAWFFGRDAVTPRLVDTAIARELTVVVGPPGCGKSSLIHAGLVPALRARGCTLLTALRPGSAPLAALGALTQELAAAARRASKQPWIVIVDQLEELLTQRPAPADRAAFLEGLAAALRASASLRVVAAVRSDAEPHLREGALRPWWKAGRFAVPAMSQGELREIVERPAAALALCFEPVQLVERLLDDAALVPDPLPLLSFALGDLYRSCRARWQAGDRDRALCEIDYEAAGGLAEAPIRRAAALHDELVAEDPGHAGTIRNVFLRMIEVAGGELARRRVVRDELVYDDAAEDRRVAEVLRRFHEAQLIALEGDAAEPAQGELVRRWPQARRWLDELEDRALLEDLADAARAWRIHDEVDSYLWSDARIERARRLGGRRPFALNAHEARFLRHCVRVRHDRRSRLVDNLLTHRRLLARSYQETGRRLVLDGQTHEALPYLLAARRAGEPRSPLRMLFAAARQTLPSALLEHRGELRRAAFSPDGARVVTASDDQTARVWDAATGAPLSPALAHQGVVWSAAFSPDGARVVTASEDHTARVWDVATGAPLLPPLAHQSGVWSAAFSPDGTRVVTASKDKTARIWNAMTGKPLCPPLEHQGTVGSAAFSADGTRLVTASYDHTARVWAASTGAPLSPPLAHQRLVMSAAFSPDGARVVTASLDQTAMIWDAVTGAPLCPPLAHQATVWSAAFSPDGARVVTASQDRTARVWDAATGKPLSPPLQHQREVRSVAFSPDGARVITASLDRTARIWDATTGKPLAPPFVHQGEVRSAAFSPDGARVVTASQDRTARVWDVTGKVLMRPLAHQGEVRSAAFSPDGARVVTASKDKTARIWDAATGKSLAPSLQHQDEVTAAAFSPDGARVVTASQDRTARIWNVATGKALSPTLVHQDTVVSAAFSPDGARVVTASQDQTARIWDAATGKPLLPPLQHQREVRSAAFSPDGARVVTASEDHTARIWNAVTGAPLSPPLEHRGGVASAAFSSDGTRVVTASADKTARVWDAATGKPLTPPLEHQGTVAGAAFSPDGARIVTASEDRTARVWDAATGKPLTPPLEHQGGVVSAAFSPDGACVVTAGLDRTARIWDAVTGKALAPPLEHAGLVGSAAFSSDGTRVVTTSGDKAAWVWEIALDRGTIGAWAAVVERSPYVLIDGILSLCARPTP